MYKQLHDFLQRPQPFAAITTKELWTRPHLARQMLNYHLDESSDLASRNPQAIGTIVDWLDETLDLGGKALCDLGCGPGLYAARFAERGARVTGVDFSANSIAYARRQARSQNQVIRYLQNDYVADPLPGGFDIVSLVYFDYCVLAPEARKRLLGKVFAMLNAGGSFVLDVPTAAAFANRQEATVIEENLMAGFWSANDYIGLQRSLLYPEELLSLDRYLILEEAQSWQVYNWLQHFTPEGISDELAQAGFAIEAMAGSLSGEELTPGSDSIGVIATRL